MNSQNPSSFRIYFVEQLLILSGLMDPERVTGGGALSAKVKKVIMKSENQLWNQIIANVRNFNVT